MCYNAIMEKRVPDFLYEKESYEIRGACFDVYKVFGGAFKEKVVDRALTEALKNRGLEVEDQKRINIYFKGKKVGVYIPDKIVNNSVLLELKAKSFWHLHWLNGVVVYKLEVPKVIGYTCAVN